ncbi:MAG: type II toxin-antitoxin system VapC family toxin [Actinomycetota bacterium]|nr:type II toxin-antitoxin system VapC family toxin [Actinomycetota bacterium]
MKGRKFVLDSFAVIAFLEGEAGADIVQKVLKVGEEGDLIYMSVVNLGEVYYSMHRAKGPAQADEILEIIDQLPITIVPADRAATLAAAKIKAVNPIAYGDCFAAALAIKNKCPVVTGDKEFKLIKDISIHWIGA